MHKDNMRAMIDFARSIPTRLGPNDEFDFTTFGERIDTEGLDDAACGTKACVLGWAAIHGLGPYEGKRVEFDFLGYLYVDDARQFIGSLLEEYGRWLDLEGSLVNRIFCDGARQTYPGSAPVTPEMVAGRLEQLLANAA